MRGLKHVNNQIIKMMMSSHPSWVRGLKLSFRLRFFTCTTSHPSWVRGLKLPYLFIFTIITIVAPLVGAWIETDCYYVSNDDFVSHPSWVRGLKPYSKKVKSKQASVAPLVGAWIETDCIPIESSSGKGRTPRGCVD